MSKGQYHLHASKMQRESQVSLSIAHWNILCNKNANVTIPFFLRSNYTANLYRHRSLDTRIQVKFANLVNLPFLAINRGHGSTTTLGTIKHGILI